MARLLLSHVDEWPHDAGFLVPAARWLRLSGHGDRAGEMLDRAARLGDSHGVWLEAEALEWPLARPAAEPHPATILLDIQDLLQFLHDHGSVSGIQRVQLGILAAVLDGEAGDTVCIAVFPSLADGSLWAPPVATLRAIIAHCTGPGLNPSLGRRLVAEARLAALRVTPTPGAAFIMLGAFWFYAGAPLFLLGLRTAGVRVGVLIYDMFPATHPEYATADTRQYFSRALAEGLPFWDFAFAISEYSAAAFRRVAASLGAPPIETVAIPLAHSFDLAPAEPPAWLDTWPSALGDLRGREFILAVSTIEIRKNHLLLFQAWKRMIEARENPPTLILVGRPGWGVIDLMGQLEATSSLNGRIMIVHGLSDAELKALYDACLFTVMPSFAEGWGLAVGESLSFGKPCIAAEGSALPEVGGDLVTYADPGSVPEWVARLREWLLDRDALAAAAARIAHEFVPRRWPSVARHLLAEAARLQARPPGPRLVAQPLLLTRGETIRIGRGDPSAPGPAEASLAQALSFVAGWYPLEADRCWMRARIARFVVRTSLPPGSEGILAFELLTPPWPGENELVVLMEGQEPVRLVVNHGQPFAIMVPGTVAPDGTMSVQLELARRPAPQAGDPRGICIAIAAVTLRTPQPAQPAIHPAPQTLDGPDAGLWVDLTSLCIPSDEIWSARRWRLGLAQALAHVARNGWAVARGEGLARVPGGLARELLMAPPGARATMLNEALAGLPPLHLARSDRLLTLGLAANNTPARMARRAGATVTLVLASIATLLRPHRAPAQAAALRAALFTPHSPFDALLLARADAAAATMLAAEARPLPWGTLPMPGSATLLLPATGHAAATPDGCVLAESWEPVMAESWSLLADPPPLRHLDADDSVGLEALLGRSRLVLAPNLAGAWPGLALAAAALGIPCVGVDPADARANAAAMATCLAAGDGPPTAILGVDWEEVAKAAAGFDPMRPAPPQSSARKPVPPALSEGWAMAATRRP